MNNIFFLFFSLFFFCLETHSQQLVDSINISQSNRLITSKLKRSIDFSKIGIEYMNNADYKNAILYLLKEREISKDKLGEEYNIAILNTISICYKRLNNYEKAKEYLFNAISINKSYSTNYFTSLELLIYLYEDLKDYSSLELISLKYNRDAQNYYGTNSEFYIKSINHLSLYYLEINNYKLAYDYILEYIKLCKDFYGVNSYYFIKANLLFSTLHTKQGKLFEAQNIITNLLQENILISNYELLIETYFVLTSIQMKLGDYNSAENTAVQIMKTIELNKNEKTVQYVLCLSIISKILLNKNNYEAAEYFLNRSIKINNEIKDGGLDNNSLNIDLISILIKNKKIDDAEKKLKEIYYSSKIKKLDKNSNKDLLWYSYNLYNYKNNTEKETFFLTKMLNLFKEEASFNLSYMNNYELLCYLYNENNLLGISLSFLKNQRDTYKDLNILVFEHQLFIKNILLNNQIQLSKSILFSNNTELIDKYKLYLNKKNELIKIKENYVNYNNINNLILEINDIERYLINNSKYFSEIIKTSDFNWTMIQNKLKLNEVIIVINCDYLMHDINNYSVLLIKKESKFPKFIPLFEEKELAILLDRNKNQQDSTRIDKQYNEYQISELILKPLEEELQGVSTIYLSLSGLTHQINFAALPIKNNQTLGQKFKIHFLNSPGELIDYTTTTFKQTKNIDFILYGGIDYDKKNDFSKEDLLAQEQNSVAIDEEIKSLQIRSGISNFGYLSGTKNEINTIEILAQKNNYQSKIIDDREATEESIKGLDGRTTPFVLHLATHGFFFPDPIKENITDNILSEGKSKIFKASDDPLMRSGLVFSGANKSWGKSNQDQTGDDGILTASEISNLDLSACQLVVLSACETGLGEVKGSEGVFGLQRAFKMAGVKNIIMSLWKVPDAQTAELFEIFYSECFTGKSIHEAFQIAQAKMKAKYSPYYWAGFVLLE